MRGFLSAMCFLLALAIVDVASAAGRRIVLVGADDGFTSAVFASLAGWDAEVVGSPGHTLVGDDVTVGRALAARHGGDAVAWTTTNREGRSELVIFDADSQRAVRRPLDRAPPFDEPTAAAVALTIKTVLRTTRIAPVTERTQPEPPPAPAPPPARAMAVRLELDGGVGRMSARSIEGRGALGLALWPSPHWGVAARIAGGIGAPVDDPRLTGHLVDLSSGIAARARFPFQPFGVELGGGGSLHAIRLAGTLVEHGADVSVPRIDPSLDASVVFDGDLGSDRARIGLRGGLSYFVRSQRFLVGGVEALEMSPLVLDCGLRISVRLD